MCILKCPKVLLQAAAQMSCQSQSKILDALGLWSRGLRPDDALQPLAFLWKTKYDETPLRVRVAFPSSSSSKDTHKIAKTWVVEVTWCATFRVRGEGEAGSEMVTICGALAPELRVSESKTGEAIVSVLDSCHRPPPLSFPFLLRLVDSDAASNNIRAERLLSELGWERWHTLQVNCLCHQVHGGVNRSMDLHSMVRTGMRNLSLHLSENLVAARAALKALVSSDLVVAPFPARLSPTAQSYRLQVTSLFTPPSSRTRAVVAVISELVLNGDWRQRMTHHCVGCCRNRDESVRKVQRALDTLFSLVLPKVLTQNWADWKKSFYFMGLFGHLHSLLFGLARKLDITQVADGAWDLAMLIFLSGPCTGKKV